MFSEAQRQHYVHSAVVACCLHDLFRILGLRKVVVIVVVVVDDNRMEADDYEGLPETTAMSTHMMAGAAAGIMEHCVMYPLDCVKAVMALYKCEIISIIMGLKLQAASSLL